MVSYKEVVEWVFERYVKDSYQLRNRGTPKVAKEVIYNGPGSSEGECYSVRFITEKDSEEGEVFRMFRIVDEEWCDSEEGPGSRDGIQGYTPYELLPDGTQRPVGQLQGDAEEGEDSNAVIFTDLHGKPIAAPTFDEVASWTFTRFNTTMAHMPRRCPEWARRAKQAKEIFYNGPTEDGYGHCFSVLFSTVNKEDASEPEEEEFHMFYVDVEGKQCPMDLTDLKGEQASRDGINGHEGYQLESPEVEAPQPPPTFEATFESVVGAALPFYNSHPTIDGQRRAVEAVEVFANGVGYFSVRFTSEATDGSEEEAMEEFRQFTIEAVECSEMSENGGGVRGGIGAFKGRELLKGGGSKAIKPLPPKKCAPPPQEFDVLWLTQNYSMADYDDDGEGCFNGTMMPHNAFLRMCDEEIKRTQNYTIHRMGGQQDEIELKALRRLKDEYFDVVAVDEQLWLSVLRSHSPAKHDMITAAKPYQPMPVAEFQNYWPWLRHVMDYSKNRYIQIALDGGVAPGKAYAKLCERLRKEGVDYRAFREEGRCYYDVLSGQSGGESRWQRSMEAAMRMEAEWEQCCEGRAAADVSCDNPGLRQRELYRRDVPRPFMAAMDALAADFVAAVTAGDEGKLQEVVAGMPVRRPRYPLSHKVERAVAEANLCFLMPEKGCKEGPASVLAAKGTPGMLDAVQEVMLEVATVEHPFYCWSPLHAAAQAGNVDMLKHLLELAAAVGGGVLLEDAVNKVESTEFEGHVPLTLACAAGKPEAVALLLGRQAAVNHKLRGGRTALHAAAASGSAEMVQMLLDAGAAKDAADEGGKVPADEAVGDDVRALLA